MKISQRLALQELRAAGYAICVFSPKELRTANAGDVEARMSTEGNETIEALVGQDPESEGCQSAEPYRG